MWTPHPADSQPERALPPLPTVFVHELIADLLAGNVRPALASALGELARTQQGADLICRATVGVASALLLAKTAMASEETQFAEQAASHVAVVHEHACLTDLANALISEEAAASDDVFRDRRHIPDALFARRLKTIQTLVRH